ncbi:MAG: YceI family protein [Saprospiraceae bacterium]|nr:YceI family protein [Saprospiraceae bacterium]
MKAIQSIFSSSLVILVVCMGNLIAQEQVIYQLEPSSQMTISGTSSLHDWESTVEQIEGTATFVMQGTEIEDIKGLVVTIPVKSIKSGKSIMDGKTYKALLEDKYPNITFSGKGIEKISMGKILVKGILNIAGVEKEVKIPADYEINKQKLSVNGTLDLKMTDFNIEPPTALMGTLKTGDEIKVSFTSELIKEIL